VNHDGYEEDFDRQKGQIMDGMDQYVMEVVEEQKMECKYKNLRK